MDDVLIIEREELTQFTDPVERAVAARLLPLLAEKANTLAEANRAEQLKAERSTLRAENEQVVTEALRQIREQHKPVTISDIEKVVNQEYVSVTVTLTERTNKNIPREFTIQELPQAIELKFLKSIQKTLAPKMQELGTVNWATGTSLEKLQRLVDMLPEALELMATNCALCLDPFGEHAITKEWVMANMSTFRIFSVIEAQIMVGKFRDFFLAISRNMQT